jgi:hypothetical protein
MIRANACISIDMGLGVVGSPTFNVGIRDGLYW